MCIISGPVVSVNGTKILAMPSIGDSSRQLTVYMNAVNTTFDNLMCLPVPHPASVVFETVPTDVFTQCEHSFMTAATLSVGRSLAFTIAKELEIRTHGSYEVVLIPSINDLERVPSRFAILTPEVKSFLRSKYPAPFGFLLCRLRAGSANYEPFAYSHARLDHSSMFLPTMHFHPHDDGSGSSTADWDHAIYTVGTPWSMHRSSRKSPSHRNQIDWAKMPDGFRWGADVQLRLMEIAGTGEPNRDILAPLATAH